MYLIFVTGLPRTGTTWIASLINAATSSTLAFEPYNWRLHPEAAGYHMKYLPSGSDDPAFIRIAEKAFGADERVVMKDVHCCLATEYLWEVFRPLVVTVIRHPCAMANSWAGVGWNAGFRIDILLNQDSLMERYLAPYRDHLAGNDDYYFQLGAYWGASYHIMCRIADTHESWHWAEHETLCRQPSEGYESLLQSMGLTMTAEGYAFLKEHDRELRDDEDPLDVPARVTALQPELWKRELKPGQVESVIEGARPFGVIERFFREDGMDRAVGC